MKINCHYNFHIYKWHHSSYFWNISRLFYPFKSKYWDFVVHKDLISSPFWASLIAQLVKNPPAMQETPVWFLGQEDPLEKG